MTEETQSSSHIDLSQLSADDRDQIIELIQTEIGEDKYVIDEDELAFSPKLTEEQAEQIRDNLAKNIEKNINRGDLGAQIIRLGTEGFKAFLIAILKPAFGTPQRNTTDSGGSL